MCIRSAAGSRGVGGAPSPTLPRKRERGLTVPFTKSAAHERPLSREAGEGQGGGKAEES